MLYKAQWNKKFTDAYRQNLTNLYLIASYRKKYPLDNKIETEN